MTAEEIYDRYQKEIDAAIAQFNGTITAMQFAEHVASYMNNTGCGIEGIVIRLRDREFRLVERDNQ